MSDSGPQPVDVRHCAAGEAIDILQEKWVLHIVHSLLLGPKGFNELGREVGGCNPTTLTQRLCRLETLGLINKSVRSVSPPRCSYGLTDAGLALEDVIDSIRAWADLHLPIEDGQPGDDRDREDSGAEARHDVTSADLEAAQR